MGYVSNITRKIVFWNYPRTSWQWDVLCVLILVFIFLTPKSWFDASKQRLELAHPSSSQTIAISSQGVANEGDIENIQRKIKEVTAREEVSVIGVRGIFDGKGRL